MGLLQGVTEFIPVSSSGHLIIADELTSIESSFAFDVLLNIGTLAALVVYFWPQLKHIAKDLFAGGSRLAISLFYSTLPIVVIGGIFIGWFEGESLRNGWVVASMLILVGAVMVGLDKIAESKSRELSSLPVSSSLAIGLGQVMALIPGTSRSASTIIVARLSGLSYRDAAQYSFLLAIPVITGAIARSLFEPETAELWSSHAGAIIAGIAASFLSGLLAIRFMLGWLEKKGLKLFGYYRLVLGLLVILTMLI